MLKKRLSDAWSILAIISLVLTLGSTALAQGVVIHLKNGDRLSGRIISESTNSVRLTNVFLGSFEVPVSQIDRREEVPAPVSVPATTPTTNAPVVAGTPATTNVVAASTNIVGGKTNVAAAAPPLVKPEPKPPMSPANPEATPIASTPSYWKHDLRFGLNLRYATKDSHEFLSILKSTYGKQPFRHIFDVNFKYGRVEGALAANSLAASQKTEYQINPRSYAFSLIGGGYDEIRKIDYQFEAGPGFGLEIVKLTNFVWKGEMGFNFQQQNRADDTRQNTYSIRIAEIFAWRVWEKLTADLKVEFFPNLDEFGEYRLRIESTLRYPVSNRLSLNLEVIDLYDTRPPVDVSNNDLQIRSTIGVTF
jgi:putative salt-induced outer membrane protein YdiY